jgi:signal recognition particle receptor subunit beta
MAKLNGRARLNFMWEVLCAGGEKRMIFAEII